VENHICSCHRLLQCRKLKKFTSYEAEMTVPGEIGHEIQRAYAEIVEGDHFVPFGNQTTDEITSYKARPTSNQRPHFLLPLLFFAHVGPHVSAKQTVPAQEAERHNPVGLASNSSRFSWAFRQSAVALAWLHANSDQIIFRHNLDELGKSWR
jgi:hypothetical protein